MDQRTFQQLYADSGVREDGKEAEARATLRRFASPIRLAVTRVLKDRNQEDDSHLDSELEQEARVLVITYAGFLPGWQCGKLEDWNKQAEGDEAQIRLLMANQLRLALKQKLAREDTRTVSLDTMLDYDLDPVDYSQEDKMINRADEASYRKLYPTLTKNVLDGMPQPEIAEVTGTPLRTVERRIAKEKRAFLAAYVQRRGLVLEGDETAEELSEAYAHLTARPHRGDPSDLPLVALGVIMIYNGHQGMLDDIPLMVRSATAALRPHKSRFDFLAVTGMSGALVGSPVAIRLAMPLVVIRKESDQSHANTDIIGEDAAKGRYVFIDDFISCGTTYHRIRERLAMPELDTRYVGCYLYSDKLLSWDGDGLVSYRPKKAAAKVVYPKPPPREWPAIPPASSFDLTVDYPPAVRGGASLLDKERAAALAALAAKFKREFLYDTTPMRRVP